MNQTTLRLSFLLVMLGICVSILKAEPLNVVVAADGSGNFKTIQEALNSLKLKSKDRVTIHLKPGTYKEWLKFKRDFPPITLVGDGTDPKETIVTYDLNAKSVPPPATQPVGTTGSTSVLIDCADFIAENVTFENSAGDTGQAVAIKIQRDRAIFRNCRFLGWQDTLYPAKGRVLFDKCYVEGRTDFIFGAATAVFNECTIHSKNGGFVTAANSTPEQKYGFVFLNCTLTGEGAQAYLGRPWQWDRGSKAAVAFINCKIGPHIHPDGWHPWDSKNTSPEQTTRYSETGSTDLDGKPLDVSKRVKWAKVLTPDEVAEYTVEKILVGSDEWNPNAIK